MSIESFDLHKHTHTYTHTLLCRNPCMDDGYEKHLNRKNLSIEEDTNGFNVNPRISTKITNIYMREQF